MRTFSVIVAAGLTAALAGAVVLVARGRAGDTEGASAGRVLDRYCVTCHDDVDAAGGVSFESIERSDLSRNAAVWETAVRKLRTGLMPPLGEPRPERAVLDATASWFEHELDAAWTRTPNPGTKPLARLNRTEYANAIRDLLAYDGRA